MNSRGNGARGIDSGVGETIVPRGVMNEERERMMNECLERIEKQMEALIGIL